MTRKTSTHDLTFWRLLLKETVTRVKAAGITDYRRAYVMRFSDGQFEFFYGDYYDGCVSASDAYEARSKGWDGYLRSIGKDEGQ